MCIAAPGRPARGNAFADGLAKLCRLALRALAGHLDGGRIGHDQLTPSQLSRSSRSSLRIFGPRRAGDVAHVERHAVGGGEECGIDGDDGDVAAGDVEPRQRIEVERGARHFGGKRLLPDEPAGRRVGEGHVDHIAQPAHEGRVEMALHVGRENGQAAVALHALQAGSSPRYWRSGRGCP